MDFFGAAQAAGVIGAGEGKGGVFDEEGVEAEVACHADGGLDGVVGDDTANDERVGPGGAEGLFEAGADEGAVNVFDDDGFAGSRSDAGFEVAAGVAGAIGGAGLA